MQSEKLQLQSEKLQLQSEKLQLPSEKLQSQSEKLQSQSEKLQSPSAKLQSPSEKLQLPSARLFCLDSIHFYPKFPRQRPLSTKRGVDGLRQWRLSAVREAAFCIIVFGLKKIRRTVPRLPGSDQR